MNRGGGRGMSQQAAPGGGHRHRLASHRHHDGNRR
jgi:hypothetical protein